MISMTENKRFRMTETELIFMVLDNEKALSRKEIVDKLNQLYEENEELKSEIENLKITIEARDTLVEVCEKKFRELGLIITVDDDGCVIE